MVGTATQRNRGMGLPKRARCPHCDRLFNRFALDGHVMKCRARHQVEISHREVSRRSTVIVDGNNVAYHLAPNGNPRVANLVLASRSLAKAGYRSIIVISAALIHSVDDPETLQRMIDSGQVVQAGKGTNDDLTIIRMAQRNNADVVSNDRFLDWRDRHPWLESRLKRYRMTPSGIILV